MADTIFFFVIIFVIATIYEVIKSNNQGKKDSEARKTQAWKTYDTIMALDKDFRVQGTPNPLLTKFQAKTKKVYEMYKRLIMRYPDLPANNKDRIEIDENWYQWVQMAYLVYCSDLIDETDELLKENAKKNGLSEPKSIEITSPQQKMNSKIELEEFENFFRNKLKESEGKFRYSL